MHSLSRRCSGNAAPLQEMQGMQRKCNPSAGDAEMQEMHYFEPLCRFENLQSISQYCLEPLSKGYTQIAGQKVAQKSR